MKNKQKSSSKINILKVRNKKGTKTYRKPCLKDLGDMRSITLGTSLGLGESTGAGVRWDGFSEF